MDRTKKTILHLAYLIACLVLIYLLCRLVFVIANKSALNLSTPLSVLKLFIYGLRFDLSAIVMTNFVFITLFLIPTPLLQNRFYTNFLKGLFVISNSIFILINLIDVVYFPFVHKRMQYNAIQFIDGEKGNDFYHLLPTFILQYWYLWLFFLLAVITLYKMYNWLQPIIQNNEQSLKSYLYSSSLFIACIGLSVIAIRGGLQMKPLNIIHASQMTEVQNIPAILNSPFTVIKTYHTKKLSEIKYIPDNLLTACYNGIHIPSTDSSFDKQNVVIIIVESLSKKYLSFFNGIGKTPFLDSLFSQSIVFNNGFANAKESIQGIPAILSSIPSWQDEPFIFSLYSTNKITSIANLLKKEGYNTSFFHGGKNGTMGFNAFSNLAGFDSYYGKNEYNNDNDYDGDWGIWDEPFLQFMANKLSQFQQPFVSTVFTLNTHHPFAIPEKYKERFKQNGHPILSCLQYTDLALSRFFEKAKSGNWFNNTLFIITADHTGPKLDTEKSSDLDDYRIPIIFYKPNSNMHGVNETIANQIDILPSALHLLNYPHPYFSLGKDLFATQCEHFSINYNTDIFQYIDSTYCYQFNGQNGIGFYNWRTDPSFINNLFPNNSSAELMKRDEALKKMIQSFNNAMINDKMWLGGNEK